MQVASLTQTVLSYVRDRIVTGKFPPGSKLNESEIANRLDISRHPLREALRVLENEYLAVSIPRKGCYVSELSAEDFLELTQTREMIECFAVDLLREKNVRKVPNIEKALEAEAKASRPPDDDVEKMLAYHGDFMDFHIKLIESTKNYRLVHFYKAISTNLARYQLIYLFMPGSVLRSVEDHKKILDFIVAGEYEKAKEFMRRHVRKTYEFLEGKIFSEKLQINKRLNGTEWPK